MILSTHPKLTQATKLHEQFYSLGIMFIIQCKTSELLVINQWSASLDKVKLVV